MKRITSIVALIIACAFTIFMFSNNSDPGTLGNSRNEIESKWKTFIQYWEAENTDDLINLFTLDAINIPPGQSPKSGHQEIGEFYEMLFEANAQSTYNHQIQEIYFNGNSATEYGKFSVYWERNDGSTWTFTARSITYWVKSDGEWKIQLFLFNNPPTED